MKQALLLAVVFSFHFTLLKAQLEGDNCSNPKAVNLICPSTVAFNFESTAGYTNDVSSWGLIMNGKDRVYAVTVPAGSKYILVSVTSTSAPFYIYSRNNNCSGAFTYSSSIPFPVNTFTNNLSIPVTGSGPYYIWIDHNNASDITYSISFGVISSFTTDLKGSWDFATGCTSPLTKPSLKVTYNGTHMNIPITYAPLGVQGTVCATLYFKNTTGLEGVKRITFSAQSSLAGFTPTVTSLPGFYNAGTWNVSAVGNYWEWIFTDAAGTGRGDFTGSPNNCLAYTFCFKMTPTSNNPFTTNIDAWAYPDGYGAPAAIGCCPTTPNCSVGATTASGGKGVAFNDPPLPVTLIDFSVNDQKGNTLIEWTTSFEENVAKFELERSADGIHFTKLSEIAARNRAQGATYFYEDENDQERWYYRLKLVDNDEAFSYSKVLYVHHSFAVQPNLHPNPCQGTFSIDFPTSISRVTISDVYERTVKEISKEEIHTNAIDIQDLPDGIYMVSIFSEDEVFRIKVSKE